MGSFADDPWVNPQCSQQHFTCTRWTQGNKLRTLPCPIYYWSIRATQPRASSRQPLPFRARDGTHRDSTYVTVRPASTSGKRFPVASVAATTLASQMEEWRYNRTSGRLGTREEMPPQIASMGQAASQGLLRLPPWLDGVRDAAARAWLALADRLARCCALLFPYHFTSVHIS